MPRLRVLAGPSPSDLVDITSLVNTNTPHAISSDLFDGQIVVAIKGFTDPDGHVLGGEYFVRPDRKGITWSIQVQGRFLQSYSADDILFGNTFDRPLNLPWGSSAALTFAKFIDPSLEENLTSPRKPWALSPFIATMPHFVHERIPLSSSSSSSCNSSLFEYDSSAQPTPRATTFSDPTTAIPPFPPEESIGEDTSQLHLALIDDVSLSDVSTSSGSSLSSFHSGRSAFSRSSQKKGENKMAKTTHRTAQVQNLRTSKDRRSYFSVAKHRKEIRFGPEDLIKTDFCYGFLEFSPSLTLRLPAGVSFDLMKYWDGQPVRFVCCERNQHREIETDEPWRRNFWCLVIESAEVTK